MMNYKGYLGNVEYDDENRVFCGKVINTRTVITFHGTTVDEIEKEFRASVDEYLDWCKEENIDPEKPYSGKLVIRMSPEMHQRSATAARLQGISLNTFMLNALSDKLVRCQMGDC